MEDVTSTPIIPGAVAILEQSQPSTSGVVTVRVVTEITFAEATPITTQFKDQFEIAAKQHDNLRLIERRARNRAIAFFDGDLGCANIFADPENTSADSGAHMARPPEDFTLDLHAC